jgi:tetratricopeptide (TPR) repeat protein
VVDIHWDFVAVSAPAFLSLGVVAGLGAERRRARRATAVGVSVLALAAVYSLAAPYASSRLVDAAYDAIADGRTAQAVSDAGSARWLDPLSVDPLFAGGDAETARFHDAAALAAYRRAVRLQPENSSTWYALGSYELFTGRYRAALHDLDRAYALDPYGPAGRPGGLLDQARAKVEGR